jgi:hypothetical protein
VGFVGLGADLSPGLHDPKMSFDDSVLDGGVKILESAVNSLLNSRGRYRMASCSRPIHWLLTVGYVVLCIVCMAIPYRYERNAMQRETNRLNALVSSIDVDMKDNNLMAASAKANQLAWGRKDNGFLRISYGKDSALWAQKQKALLNALGEKR